MKKCFLSLIALGIFCINTVASTRILQPLKKIAQNKPRSYILGDVEGVWERIENYIKLGIIDVSYDNDGNLTEVEVVDKETELVFLGDATDKGKDNLKVLTFFVLLAEKTPGVSIKGNRDMNKLRVLLELDRAGLKMDNDSLRCYRLGNWEESFNNFIHNPKKAVVDGEFIEYKFGESPETDRIIKRKWMFECTMGAATFFEDLKKECEDSLGRTVSDKEVSDIIDEHFLDPINGLYPRYLRNTSMISRNKETGALYVHGYITPGNIGGIGETRKGKGDSRIMQTKTESDFDAWSDAKNIWAHDCEEAAYRRDAEGAYPYIEDQEPEVVIQGKKGKAMWAGPNNTTTQERQWGTDDNIGELNKNLACRLYFFGIRSIFSGHSPAGQVPVIIKTPLSAEDFYNELTEDELRDGLNLSSADEVRRWVEQEKPTVLNVLCDTSASKPRYTVIENTREKVSVEVDFYPEGAQEPVRLKYDSLDPEVGTFEEIDGEKYIKIARGLKAHFGKHGGPFITPKYIYDPMEAMAAAA